MQQAVRNGRTDERQKILSKHSCSSKNVHIWISSFNIKKYQTLYLEMNDNNDKNQNNFSAPHSDLACCRRHKIYRLFHAKIQLSS